MSREDQHQTTVTVDGVPLGVFDTIDGGEADSEETKYRPGGMAEEISLGGRGTISNVTLGRLYELARDHDTIRWLMARRGKARATVTRQPLDVDGNAFGRPFVYTGTVKTVTLPKGDSNSNNAAVWTMVVSTEGNVG